ncbi:MAG: GFA family protein [Deltaproteobacteria bacterium]|nr:GFA family protein [Deltaproteobacteria bacterium]
MTHLNAHCLCGAVRARLELPTLFGVHCHCRWCRRAHGAAYVTWTGVPEERFELVSGETSVTWYASSRWSRRGFCPTCGTTLFFQTTAAPGEIHVAAACLEGELDREIGAHVFFEQHLPWVSVDEHLPRLEGDDPALAAYAEVGK